MAIVGDKDQETGLCMIPYLCVPEVFFIFNCTSKNTTCILKSSQQKGLYYPSKDLLKLPYSIRMMKTHLVTVTKIP